MLPGFASFRNPSKNFVFARARPPYRPAMAPSAVRASDQPERVSSLLRSFRVARSRSRPFTGKPLDAATGRKNGEGLSAMLSLGILVASGFDSLARQEAQSRPRPSVAPPALSLAPGAGPPRPFEEAPEAPPWAGGRGRSRFAPEAPPWAGGRGRSRFAPEAPPWAGGRGRGTKPGTPEVARALPTAGRWEPRGRLLRNLEPAGFRERR